MVRPSAWIALVKSEVSCVADSWRGCESATSLAATWMGYRHCRNHFIRLGNSYWEKLSRHGTASTTLSLIYCSIDRRSNVPSHGATWWSISFRPVRSSRFSSLLWYLGVQDSSVDFWSCSSLLYDRYYCQSGYGCRNRKDCRQRGQDLPFEKRSFVSISKGDKKIMHELVSHRNFCGELDIPFTLKSRRSKFSSAPLPMKAESLWS